MFARPAWLRFPRWPVLVTARTAVRRAVMIAFEYLLAVRFARHAGPVVALTFDDGPHAERTPQLLAVLRELDVPATFFLVGVHVEKAPLVVRALADAGMEIGNHSLSHISLRGKPPAQQMQEIMEGARVIAEAAGQPVRLFRPPYGHFDEFTVAAVAAAGQRMVLWNVNPHEWMGTDAVETVTRGVKATRAPVVILMHDASLATVAAIPRIVAAYRRAGFRFAPASEIPEGTWQRYIARFAE
jgi:peptidoglycan/xylan/chitin deacetylase (PgdA/CDA1 family)